MVHAPRASMSMSLPLCPWLWLWAACPMLACSLPAVAHLGRAVRMIDLGPLAGDGGINMAELENVLTAYETEYFTLYTANITSELLLIEFPLEVVAGRSAVSFILGASFSRGSFDDVGTFSLLHYPAEDTDETLFTFRLTEDMRGIDLLREELTLRTSDDGTLLSLSESAPPQWVATLPVLDLRQREGIDEPFVLASAEVLLMNGFFVTSVREGTFTGMRVKLSETRSYPKNAGLTVEYQLAVPDEWETRSVPVSLRFSISLAPLELMLPRRSDERVGYFNTVYKDLGDHRGTTSEARSSLLLDTQVTMINKRRMGGDSPPLIYYVDPSVPEEWRQYLKTGVENWQPAFKNAGLGEKAIRAVLPDDDDWPEDYDAGDIRFNSITWAIDISETFAIGPSTLDPRTGEILHSAIIFTDGWIASWTREIELLGYSPAESRRRSLLEDGERPPERRGHSHSHVHTGHDEHHGHHGHQGYQHRHQYHGHGHDHSHDHDHGTDGDGHRHPHLDLLDRIGGKYGGSGGNVDYLKRGRQEQGQGHRRVETPLPSGMSSRKHGARGSLRYHSRTECQEARLEDISMSLLPLVAAHHERSRSLAEDDAGTARGATPGAISNEILGAGLVDVVMHEVGHTLGLRHNFKGSTSLSLHDLQNTSKTSDQGLTSSVMDYLPLNLVSSEVKVTQESHLFTPTVGAYDMWAIKYGYKEVDGEGLLVEHEELKQIASMALPFSTDEDEPDPEGINPLASLFDLGDEPLDYWEDQLELVTELRPVLLERAAQEGESFTRYGEAERSMLRLVFRSTQYMTKYIGGFDTSKQRRLSDSTQGPIQRIEPDRQRRALEVILRVLGGDEPGGGASFLPEGEDFQNMAVHSGVCDSSLEQYCYALKPIDILGEVSLNRKLILLSVFELARLRRMRLQTWAVESETNGAGDVLTIRELFQSTTDAIWGENLFSGQRVKLWRNWEIMLFWVEVLQVRVHPLMAHGFPSYIKMATGGKSEQAYGSADSSMGVPGEVSATALSTVYSIAESGANLNISDPTYSLYRTVSHKMTAWEQHGTSGLLLSILLGMPM